MSNASFKMNGVEVFSENAQTVTLKNINVDPSDTTTPSMCKAWVNFNGTLELDNTAPETAGDYMIIRASYNVQSVQWNGTGDYTVNFTTAMPDANYSVVGATLYARTIFGINTISTGSVRVSGYDEGSGYYNSSIFCVAIFR
jgi:hypothetical protein